MKYMYENREAEKVNPILIDKAIGFFLENQMLGDILQGCKIQKKYATAPNIKVDYAVEDTCIETKIFMNNGRTMEANLKSLLYLLDSNKHNLNVLLGHYKRVVLLVVCDEGVCDGQMRESFIYKEVGKIFEEELAHGVEIWISGIRLEKDGIALMSCQKIAPSD